MGRGANFSSSLGSTDHKAKVYSLMPFLIESALTPKSFVLRMQLYPKAELLRLDTLKFSGVEPVYIPVN